MADPVRFCRCLGSAVVQISVGPDKTIFSIHKELLSRNSEFFIKAFSETWNNRDTEGNLMLPEDYPAVFGIIVTILYGYALMNKEENVHFQKLDVGLRAYVLPDKLLFPNIQNIIFSSIRHYLESNDCVFEPLDIKYIYRNTPSKSPLRKLAIDVSAWAFYECIRNRNIEEYKSCFEQVPEFDMEMCLKWKAVSYSRSIFEDPRGQPKNDGAYLRW